MTTSQPAETPAKETKTVNEPPSNDNRTGESLDHVQLILADAIRPELQELRITPWGHVQSTNGEFLVDQQGAERAINAFTEHGTDLPIDYEHQTLGGHYAAPSGRAPAAGWIRALRIKPNVGLLGTVKWTGRARKMIEAGEYRYLSPVALIRKSDRKLVAIHSAALTNKPAIKNMLPLNQTGKPTTTEEQLLAAHKTIQELMLDREQQHHQQLIKQALDEGKLLPNQRPWAQKLIAQDQSLFLEWLELTPPALLPGRLVTPDTTQSINHDRADSNATRRREFRQHPWLADITSEEAYARYASPDHDHLSDQQDEN